MAQSGGPFRPTRSSTCQSSKNTHDVSLCSKRPGQKRSPAEIQNTFTKCTQTWNIKMLQEQREEEDDEEWVSSEEWLKWRSLENCNLTLPHLYSCSTAPAGSLTDNSTCSRLEINPELLADFESQLYQVIEMYHSRIRWLTHGSRKVFGLVTGSRLAVMIDSSDISCSEERLPDLQRHLLLLAGEQLRKKEQLHMISFGTDVSCLWEKPRELTKQRLQEVQDWILQLRSTGCCNLLQALEELCRHTQLDSMLIILGSCPDQSVDALLSYMAELVQDRELSVHVVSYNTCSPAATEAVKNIAKVTGGRYHLFSAALGVVDSSSDLEPLWAEIKSARDILQHIPNMQCGFKDVPVSEISTNLDSLSLSELDSGLGSRPDLCLQPAGPLPSTSVEWLKTHGLKAKKLGLYQVLAPNVYSPRKGFVPILGKSVHSKVHEKAMVQFEWHDGTVKNVHVDLPSLQCYQRRLLEAVCVLEDRVTWLNSTSCRQIWGTVCEQSLQILVDMAHMSIHYHLHLLHAVRLLLQEQLPNTHTFNIIVFGSDVKPFREQMAPSTPENIQAAWQWIQELECGGQRNTLTALRHAVDSQLHTDSSVTRGVYLFTTGMPDQDTSAISSYVAEFYSGPMQQLHVCLFTREEQLEYQAPSYLTRDEVALYLRNLAHAANGRFHYITDTGILESDDIIVLIGEMQKAANYWQKCCDLVDSLVQKSFSSDPEEASNQECHSPDLCPKSWTRKCRLPPPRDTRLSLARLERKEGTRSHTWRPNSAKAVIPPAGPVDGWEPVRQVKSTKTLKTDVSRSVFYLENGNLGSVFKTYIKPKSAQKYIGTVKIPKHESISSTKQWLKLFGIRRLKLDLHRLLSGPECTHRKKLVPSVHKSVSAKYCAIFPSVQLNGTVRHLFLSAGELKQYLIESERVLQRYAQRMQWLLTGSRRVFGCVLERAVCVMLDVSGSMAPCLPTLNKEITSLIWDQLHVNNIKFSMLAFSEEVQMWQDELVEASEQRCRDAVTWLAQLNTHGGSSILHALQVACVFGDSVGLYLISDGRFDCSCDLVLKEVERLTAGKHVTIHTITFNSLDSFTMNFLKTLAHKTGGRFHQVISEADTVEANELLIRGFIDGEDPVLPPFEGDDLKRLKAEIEKLTIFQKQAKAFRDILLTRNPQAPALSK